MFTYKIASIYRKLSFGAKLVLVALLVASIADAQTTDPKKNNSAVDNQSRQNYQGTPAEQATRGEIPQSFANELLKLPSQKIRRLMPTSLPEQPVRMGKIQQNGIIRNLEPLLRLSSDNIAFDVSGGKVYLSGVVSEGAKSIRVKFEKMNLPEGARIFVYPVENRDEFYGAFGNKSALADGTFWTPPVQGDGIIIELFVPSDAKTPAQDYFQIKEISHNFAENGECALLGLPGNCHNEVGSGYANLAGAVGYLEFISECNPNNPGQESCICTGTLMNTVSGNFAPFLMTANHCISTEASAQSLRTYWNYNTGNSPPGGTPFTDGATLLSTSSQSDFTFVKLTGSVTGGLTYVGWDGGDPAANSLIVGIHHPQGSHKRISFGFTSAIGSICDPGLPSACGNFIPVTWNSGVTEGGSSGSGLFYTVANGGRFIGNLFGGLSFCSSPNAPDWYGRFSLTYGKVSTYLADGNCTYGISPGSNNFPAVGGNGSFNVTTGSACFQSAVVTQPTTVQTFSNSASISIADRPTNSSPPGLGSLYPSNINVSGLSGTVTRVRVTLNGLTHTYPDDLDFLLVGPNGQRALLMSDSGGSTDVNNTSLTIDQSGLTLLSDQFTNSTGNYRPSNYAGLTSVDTGGSDNFPSPASGQTTYDSLLTVFYGSNPNGTWRLYVVDDEAGDIGSISGGWSLELATNNTSWLSISSGGVGYGNSTVNYSVASNPTGQPRTGIINVGGQTHTIFQSAGTTVLNRKPSDFDGDNKTDVSIFRPSSGQWWINRSSTNQTVAVQFGLSSDKPTPADFTGDGKTDIAFWRPSTGFWFIVRSEDSSFYSVPFGATGDIPAPGDFDGDGRADPAVYRPSSGTWYISKSTGGTTIQQFGIAEDKPVVADYDGDGKADIAVFRPSTGVWWLLRSSLGVIAAQFGTGTDKPVQGDYSGDGKADIAVWRPSTGFWFILRSEDSSFYSVPFGTSGDIAAPGDYDGDGKFDTAVFRPSNTNWYVQRSTTGTLIQQFGATGDLPLPASFVP